MLNKSIYILLVGLFSINIVYSQSCIANAGGDLDIILEHDGNPSGEVTFDGSATTGNDLGNFEWNIYHLPVDTLAYILNGTNPTIDIDCYSTLEDEEWTNCVGEYRVVLSVTCDDESISSDIINLLIEEPNEPPLACLTTDYDYLLIPGSDFCGEQIDALLYTYIEFSACPQPDGDLRSWLWYDEDGNNIAPIVSLGEGIYQFTHRVQDAYETYDELTLTLELEEGLCGIFGCTDPSACNYLPEANEDDGSCIFEYDCTGECGGDAEYDCAGDCNGSTVVDCAGECNGSAVLDDCGVCDGFNNDMDCAGECNGSAVEDCAGECNGSSVIDECGICGGVGAIYECGCDDEELHCRDLDGDGWGTSEFTYTTCDVDGDIWVINCDDIDDSIYCESNELDCIGILCGDAIIDDCGVCDGSNNDMDCAGECNGSAVEDCAGECNGDGVEDCAGECNGSAIEDCEGICNGGLVIDECGVCGGNNEIINLSPS